MKIAACVKAVPDRAGGRRIDPATLRLDRSGDLTVSDFDLHPVEEALRLRERAGEGEVVVCSLGPPGAADALRKTLAMGADRAVLVSDAAFAGADPLADTGTSPTLDPDRIDMLLEAGKQDASGATTREMRPQVDGPTVETPAMRSRSAEAPTVETPVIKPRPGGEAPTVETPVIKPRPRPDVPTVETPQISAQHGGTAGGNLDAALKRGEKRVAPESTAELSLDDLGFELDKLGDTSTSLESLAATDHPADAPTMVASIDDRSRALFQAAERTATELEPTRETPRPPMPAAARRLEASGTSRLQSTDADATGTQNALATGNLDLDLDELAKALEHDTVEQPRREEVRFSTDVFGTGIRRAPNGVDLDVGAPLGDHREPTVTERMSAENLDLPELEPVTLSEVGTKLDLARAYMDMGDPDGARSILQEVLSEGSASQKTEAQRLIETLPG